MSTWEIFLVMLGVLQVVWVIDIIRGKSPRRLLVKEWFNSVMMFLGFLSALAFILMCMVCIWSLATVVEHNYYSDLSWTTIATVMITEKIMPWVMLFIILAVWISVVRLPFRKGNAFCLWKYTPAELQFVKDRKEKIKSKWPQWLKDFDAKLTKIDNWKPGFVKRWKESRKAKGT